MVLNSHDLINTLEIIINKALLIDLMKNLIRVRKAQPIIYPLLINCIFKLVFQRNCEFSNNTILQLKQITAREDPRTPNIKERVDAS